MTTYTKTAVNGALAAKANKSTTNAKTEVNEALSAKANQLTTFTKTEVDNALSDKLSKLTAADPANSLGAPMATGFPILTGQIIHQWLSP